MLTDAGLLSATDWLPEGPEREGNRLFEEALALKLERGLEATPQDWVRARTLIGRKEGSPWFRRVNAAVAQDWLFASVEAQNPRHFVEGARRVASRADEYPLPDETHHFRGQLELEHWMGRSVDVIHTLAEMELNPEWTEAAEKRLTEAARQVWRQREMLDLITRDWDGWEESREQVVDYLVFGSRREEVFGRIFERVSQVWHMLEPPAYSAAAPLMLVLAGDYDSADGRNRTPNVEFRALPGSSCLGWL